MEGDVLRDMGCSGVIVKQRFVTNSQYTGKFGFMQMADNTLRRVPIATVSIDTPYPISLAVLRHCVLLMLFTLPSEMFQELEQR